MIKLSIGIDIGGTNTSFGLVDCKGEIYGEGSISTAAYPHFTDYKDYIQELAKGVRRMIESVSVEVEVETIGIGAPNANMHSGAIEQPANLWKYADEKGDESLRIFHICRDLKALLSDISHIAITNDANAATLGEMMFGNGRGMRDFAMITLGTGLGSGFVASGEMICGHDGFAGEMGHITVIPNGRECGCGRRGCLECYVSATGIKRTAFEMMALKRWESPLRSISYEELSSEMIYRAAESGDDLAMEIFRYTGEVLGAALANMVTITSPEAIIIFGGLAKSGEMLFEPTRRYMEENLMPIYRGKIKILPSALQDKNIAILGAAALGMKR